MNENVNNEDIEDEDVEIEVDDDAELIFPYEVEGDQTPPPRDKSSDPEPHNAEPPNVESSDSVSSDSESEDEEVDVAPEATVGTSTQKPYAIRDFPRGLYEVGESSSARASSYVGGLVPWALRRDLDATHARARLMKTELGKCRVWNKRFYLDVVRIGAVLKPPSDDEDTERPRKKSKKSSSDGTEGPSEPRGPPSNS
ncbi:hypothetical protein Tco_0666186 [Tanacetum coccineum]